MKKYLLTSLLCLTLITPIMANNVADKEQALVTTVHTLKHIIQNALSEEQAKAELNKIPQTKPFIKDKLYMGHKLFENTKLVGLLRVTYQNKKPALAAYSTVPMKVRHATKLYRSYRETLSKHYKEISRNHFDLGDGIIAELRKKKNGLSVFVNQKK